MQISFPFAHFTKTHPVSRGPWRLPQPWGHLLQLLLPPCSEAQVQRKLVDGSFVCVV